MPASSIISGHQENPGAFLRRLDGLTARKVGGLECESPPGADFDARLINGNLGRIDVCHMTASPHRFTRPVKLLRPDDAGTIKVILQKRGYTILEQDRKAVLLGPGDCALCDTAKPYSLINDSEIESIFLLIPHVELDARETPYRGATATSFNAMAASGRQFSAFMSRFFDQMRLRGFPSDDDCVDYILRLLDLALRTRFVDHGSPTPRNIMRSRIKCFVVDHLRDPTLSTDKIATALGCSKRYLHKMFDDQGETLNASIWRLRLDGCKNHLARKDQHELSITEIAFFWGFSSSPHFSRSFRARFGMSPRAWREQALATAIGIGAVTVKG